MKPIVLTLWFFLIVSNILAADDSTSKSKHIRPGMGFSEVTEILSAAGFSGEEGHYDMIVSEGIIIRYFPIAANVTLMITYEKASKQVKHLTLMTSPSYRPVKGLEVYLSLLSIAFEKDGTFIAHFAPRAKLTTTP